MKRILLTGISGQVGRELQRTLQPLGDVIACDRSRFDLTQPEALRATLQALRPTLIVNPAAYTAVDKAESEPDLAMTINATAPAVLAEFAREADALLVHFSTDYVFAGDQPTAYSEDDIPAPLGVYGRSKLAGEQAITASGCRHLIFRTSWVYGLHGHNFLKTMLRLAQERDELRVVDDQFGAPTWSRMIAETVAAALARYQGQHGIYHCSAGGFTTWHGFAEAIIDRAHRQGLLNKTIPVRRITTADFPTPAKRPANSRLDCDRLQHDFDLAPPDWETQLGLCLG